MYKRSARILFVGLGPHGRSRMAQGWAAHLGTGRLQARAADIAPQTLHPGAVTVMREAGVDIAHLPAVTLTPGLLAWADLVVTVCRDADESCPAIPDGVQKRLWALEDPVAGQGGATLSGWRTVRDDLRYRVAGMIGGMKMLERMDPR